MKMFTKAGKIVAIASVAGMLTVTAAMAQDVYVQGTVLPTKSGFELVTDGGQTYQLEGQTQNLSRLAPRSVQVTGDLEEGASGKTIQVKTVQNGDY